MNGRLWKFYTRDGIGVMELHADGGAPDGIIPPPFERAGESVYALSLWPWDSGVFPYGIPYWEWAWGSASIAVPGGSPEAPGGDHGYASIQLPMSGADAGEIGSGRVQVRWRCDAPLGGGPWTVRTVMIGEVIGLGVGDYRSLQPGGAEYHDATVTGEGTIWFTAFNVQVIIDLFARTAVLHGSSSGWVYHQVPLPFPVLGDWNVLAIRRTGSSDGSGPGTFELGMWAGDVLGEDEEFTPLVSWDVTDMWFDWATQRFEVNAEIMGIGTWKMYFDTIILDTCLVPSLTDQICHPAGPST